MVTKFRKWKFKKTSHIFIKEKRLDKLIKSKKVIIFDSRPSMEFNKNKFKDSINTTKFKIRSLIQERNKKETIVLVGEFKRSHASDASWARYIGYKNIYLAPSSKVKK